MNTKKGPVPGPQSDDRCLMVHGTGNGGPWHPGWPAFQHDVLHRGYEGTWNQWLVDDAWQLGTRGRAA